MRNAWTGICTVLLVVCYCLGCGRPGPDVVPASGVVTLNGQPIEGAVVVFQPLEGGSRSSHGTTDAQGNFKLSTFGMNDGALAGKHAVTIAKAEQPEEANFDPAELQKKGYGGMSGYGEMMGVEGKKKLEAEYIIDKKYSDPKTSNISVEVVPGETNEFTFNLE